MFVSTTSMLYLTLRVTHYYLIEDLNPVQAETFLEDFLEIMRHNMLQLFEKILKECFRAGCVSWLV